MTIIDLFLIILLEYSLSYGFYTLYIKALLRNSGLEAKGKRLNFIYMLVFIE